MHALLCYYQSLSIGFAIADDTDGVFYARNITERVLRESRR